MRDYTNLRAWHLAKDLARELQDIADRPAVLRIAGANSQIVRAANSIPNNIAEGCSRSSPREFARYIEIALGSQMEVDSNVRMLAEREIVTESEQTHFLRRLAVLRRMLAALRDSGGPDI